MSAFLCMVWSQARIFLRTSHGRNRINILGAVNAVSKEVSTLINTTYITAETIMKFLILLKEKYSQKSICLVLDNAKYQHCNTPCRHGLQVPMPDVQRVFSLAYETPKVELIHSATDSESV
jgi:hypothetical protein